ncbi:MULTISPECIES: hypothetical protein [unclassified Sinorhizobium]|uniref:hypothetical protein n=1 Tax=unclassified Sinorhizobium TaxID=2613772 RepID=UPI00352324BC
MPPTENMHYPKPDGGRQMLRLVAVDGEIIADELASLLEWNDPLHAAQFATEAAPASPPKKRRWRRMLLQSLIEGFALIGAASYPTADFIVPWRQETQRPETRRSGSAHIPVSLARRLLEAGVYFE